MNKREHDVHILVIVPAFTMTREGFSCGNVHIFQHRLDIALTTISDNVASLNIYARCKTKPFST